MQRISATGYPDGSDRLRAAAEILEQSVISGQVRSAVIIAHQGTSRIEQAFGEANIHSSFLLGSISKPVSVAALMSLYKQGAFQLSDAAQKYLPEFKGDGRERVTMQHLLTHVSGLPDQLPTNARLRKSHAPLSEFVNEAMRVPLGFEPGTKYEYSSMAILLAAEIAQRLSNRGFLQLVDEAVFQPLKMTESALGMGRLSIDATVPVQTEHAAAEAGGGDPTAKLWDWNSHYWRELGAPWGGVHASAGDVTKFLDAFVNTQDHFLPLEVTKLMIHNHNANHLVARGLGFALGPEICRNCSTTAFGHTG